MKATWARQAKATTTKHQLARLTLSILLCTCAWSHAAAQQADPARLFTVAGTLVNAVTGEPVPGAAVVLTGQSDDKPLAKTHSSSDGHFVFPGVAAGKYRLSASRLGYATNFYEQHGDFSSAVVTGPGEDTGNLLFRLPPQAILRGTISDDTGEPVPEARIQLFRKPGAAESGSKTYRIAIENTDDAGFYEFANLSPGDYLIAVVADPWYALHTKNSADQVASALDLAYPVTYYDSTTDEASALPIHLGPGNRFEANINLHAVPALRFFVAPPRGQNNPNATAELRQSIFGTTEPRVGAGVAEGNKQGEIEFSGIAPGRYALVTGSPARTMTIDATNNDPVDASSGIPAAAVSGKVEAAPGIPYPGPVLVTLVPTDAASGQREVTTLVEEGKFNLQDVPTGNWTVKLSDGYGYVLSVDSIVVGKRRLAGKTLSTSGQPLELTVTAQQSLQTVQGFALSGGKGVAGTMIVLVPEDLRDFPERVRRDQSDSDGSFVLPHVAPGRYKVIALANAWDQDWAHLETIARYLSGGLSVTVSAGTRETMQLAEPVAVQPAQ